MGNRRATKQKYFTEIDTGVWFIDPCSSLTAKGGNWLSPFTKVL